VLDQACQQAQLWAESGVHLRTTVNLSVHQLAQPDLVDHLADLVKRHRLTKGSLTLEITEGALVQDSDRAAAVMREIADLGIRLEIDDFGQGYSSFAHLKRFPVHGLKLDKMFVADLVDGSEAAAIVRSLVSMAAVLGIEITIEGVETAHQLEMVTALGCDYAQGYHLFGPADADTIERWARSAVG
jgi:EAL domain-containing protein (putative c-di-GMP-specific phosphodiesterase class I)